MILAHKIRTVQQPSRSERSKGITLVELMMALSIGVLVMGFVAVFSVQSSKSMFKSTEELRFNNTLRQTFARMQEDVREASVVSIYPSFDSADRNAPTDILPDGVNGNMLVLLTFENNNTTTPIHEEVARIVGYYLDPNTLADDGSMIIYRWEAVPASGKSWYGNPSIDASRYKPSSNISADPNYGLIEDYFASVTTSHPSITEIARIRTPGNGIFVRTSQATVNVAVDTLFGNENAKMLQSISLSFSAGG